MPSEMLDKLPQAHVVLVQLPAYDLGDRDRRSDVGTVHGLNFSSVMSGPEILTSIVAAELIHRDLTVRS